LENATVLVLFQEGEPAAAFQFVGVLVVVLSGIAGSKHVAVEETLVAIVQINVDADTTTQQGIYVQVRIGRLELQTVLRYFAKGFFGMPSETYALVVQFGTADFNQAHVVSFISSK
jgi:hypothetical protein